MKKMHRLLHFFGLLLILTANAHAFSFKSLLGKESEDTKVLAGSVFYHTRDLYDEAYRQEHKGDNFRPSFGVTHKGWVAYYFYTSHKQHSASVGIERYWYHNKEEKTESYIGYRAGVLYGYCSRNISKYEIFEECTPESKYHFFPMAQIFYNKTFGHLGFELATAVLMSNATLIYRF